MARLADCFIQACIYSPDVQVSIDGIELTDMNVRFLRDSVGVVSQEPVLFDGTIESNIRLGNETCSREQVIAAFKQVWTGISLGQ